MLQSVRAQVTHSARVSFLARLTDWFRHQLVREGRGGGGEEGRCGGWVEVHYAPAKLIRGGC